MVHRLRLDGRGRRFRFLVAVWPATAQIDLCSDLRDRFGHRVREFTWHSYMVPLRPEANVKKDATVASGSWPTVFLGLIR